MDQEKSEKAEKPEKSVTAEGQRTSESTFSPEKTTSENSQDGLTLISSQPKAVSSKIPLLITLISGIITSLMVAGVIWAVNFFLEKR